MDNKLYLTYSELSEFIGISVSALKNLVRSKQIPHLKISRSVRFDLNDVQSWLEDKKQEVDHV